MIPLILISDNKRTINKYIKGLAYPQAIVIDIAPLATEFTIGQIRELFRESTVAHPETRIYLLHGFDQSSLEAQNAFLKLLEEPPAKTLFILTVQNPYRLLPTITSRARTVVLEKNAAKEVDTKLSIQLTRLYERGEMDTIGSPDFTVATREQANALLEQMLLFFRHRLATDKRSPAILNEIIKTNNLLINNNLTPQLTVDHLLIFIRKSASMK